MDLNKYLETERRTKNLIRFLTALSVLSLFVAAGKERTDPSGASAVLVCSLLLLVFCGWMLWKTRPGREVYENAEFYENCREDFEKAQPYMRDNFRIGEKYLFRRGISVIIPVKDIRLVEFGKGTGVHGGYTWCGVKAENRKYAGCICTRKEAEELFEALKQKNPDIFWNDKTV